MYISGIQYESIVDGDGLRVTIFCSGCYWDCKGCHNPNTHSFTNGRKFDLSLQNHIIDYIKNNPMIKGITLSGGDPMFSAKDLVHFIKKLKEEINYINIWCYTGFTYENIINCNDERFQLLKLCDVLVDGKFIIELKDITLKFRGSSNQRLINIKESLMKGGIIKYEN